jgi:hypothetical protein
MDGAERMIRHYNYTNRLRLPQKCVTVRTFINPDGVQEFDASIDLIDQPLSPGLSIYVETFYRNSMMRFDAGTITEGQTQYFCRGVLTDLQSPQTNFRVKIVDQSENVGLLVAVADRIKTFIEDANRFIHVGLLPVQFEDLGDQIWRLEFPSDDGEPVLCVNNTLRTENIPVAELIRYPIFITLVYPQVVRRILEYILIERDDLIDEDRSDHWAALWIKFALSIPGNERPPQYDKENMEEMNHWVENVVQTFCQQRRIKDSFEKFVLELQS